MAEYVITYFPARGRAELARIVLAAAGQEWKDESVTGETFPALKQSGKLPFGQVPILTEGDFVLAQSNAIARYLANKHHLYGTPQQGAIADMILDGYADFINKLVPLVFGPSANPEKYKEFVATVVPTALKQFEDILKKNHNGAAWAAGDSFSFADLVLFGLTESVIDQEWQIENFPILKAHYDRVIAHSPSLAAYLKSEKRFPARKN